MKNNLYINKLKAWMSLWENNKLTDKINQKYISFFANSSLPNSWFLQQFSGHNADEIFYEKCNWELFASILIERGIDKLGSNLIDLLEFLYEGYYNSYYIIRNYVLTNFNVFKSVIISYVLKNNDSQSAWLIQNIIDALCDIDACYRTTVFKRFSLLINDLYEKKIQYNEVKNEILVLVNYLLDNFLITNKKNDF